MKKLINIIFDKLGVDPKEFLTGMLVHLIFFIILGIAMIATKTWGFDIVLVYYFGCGVLISTFFNLLNPNNKKK